MDPAFSRCDVLRAHAQEPRARRGTGHYATRLQAGDGRDRNIVSSLLVLRENGYRTKAVSANMWVCESSGFDIGFDDFVSINAKRTAKMDRAGLRARAKWRFEAVQARVDDGAEEAGRIIRGWANDPGDEPFFWFVNLVECHSPYLPPTPYNSLGVVDRARAADEASEFLYSRRFGEHAPERWRFRRMRWSE